MPTFSIANSNRNDRNPSEDFVNGFELHMFEIDKPNIYKHKSLLFKHPHRETCQKWLSKITEFIPSNNFIFWLNEILVRTTRMTHCLI